MPASFSTTDSELVLHSVRLASQRILEEQHTEGHIEAVATVHSTPESTVASIIAPFAAYTVANQTASGQPCTAVVAASPWGTEWRSIGQTFLGMPPYTAERTTTRLQPVGRGIVVAVGLQ